MADEAGQLFEQTEILKMASNIVAAYVAHNSLERGAAAAIPPCLLSTGLRPLYPQERTSLALVRMSPADPKRTFGPDRLTSHRSIVFRQ